MTEEQHTFWGEIENFEIDNNDSAFTFSERLARENNWSLEYALRAMEEYKKFMFLICITDHPLTPSDQVDQVWHLHLIYTRSYWTEFCKHILKREIHHGPTKGGQKEKHKYNDFYELTKERYYKVFGVKPPTDLWPPARIRFGELNFARINRHRNWILPKPKFTRK